MNKLNLLAGLGVVTALAGCALDTDKYQSQEYDEASNPAFMYCVQQGGELESFTENGKRIKYCVFSDDEKHEALAYYEQRSHKEQG